MSDYYAGCIILLGWTEIDGSHREKEMEYLWYHEEDELLYCRDEGQEVCFDSSGITKIIRIEE